MAFFTEDAVYHNIPMKPASGKAAIRTTIKRFCPRRKDSIAFKILHTASSGNVVFNERVDVVRPRGKNDRATGRGRVRNQGGKISAWRDYFDLQMFTKQMS